MKPLIVFAFLGVALSACKDTEKKETVPKESRSKPLVHKEKITKTIDLTEAEPEHKLFLTGEATLTGATDSSTSDLQLELKKNNAVKDDVNGELNLAGTTYQLSGIRQSSNLSLWLSKTGNNPDEARRGFMFAEIKEGSYIGIFAVSGNGGTSPANGTWKANGVGSE